MTYSYVEYSANGSTTDYNVTFDYLDRSHVLVLLDGAETDEFSWLSSTQIRFDDAPASGTIRIKRSTPIDELLVSFQNGSTLDAENDLDVSSRQILFLNQEAFDNNVEATFPDESVTTDKLADGAVTIEKIGDLTARTVIANDTAGTATPTARSIEDLTVLADNATSRRDLSAWFGDVLNVKAFGAVGDGSTDDTSAIQSALNQSASDRNRPVYFPTGDYKLTSTITVKNGTMLLGCGSQGSTSARGTVLQIHHNGNGIDFDPTSGADFVGTGGGMKDFLIIKATGYTGGDCIKVLAVNDNRRPGEMIFSNVLSYGSGTGMWTRGLHVDGSACDTPGGRGVRSIMLLKVRMADVSTAYESFRLNQVTHVYGTGIQCDTGDGSTAGITILGTCENIDIAVECNGHLLVDSAATVNGLNISGRVSYLDIQSVDISGVANIWTSNLVTNKSKDFRVIASGSTGEIRLRKTSSTTNATGDNTSVAVTFDTADKDSGFNVSLPNNQVQILCAGTYLVEAQVLLTNLGAAHTRSDCAIALYDSGGASIQSVAAPTNPYATAFSTSQSLTQHKAIFECDYGDLIKLNANVSGSTKTVTIYGNSGTVYTFLHIKRIG